VFVVTTVYPASADNRRAIVRIVASEMVRIAGSMARRHDDDVIEYMVFTAIWVLNSEHLIGDERYAALKSIPPNVMRRPATLGDLQREIPMPEPILTTYVDRLLKKGFIEQAPGGLIAPTAVFTEPDMLEGADELYGRMMQMATSMRNAGFSFGDDQTQPKEPS
jgi:hypothetical protein